MAETKFFCENCGTEVKHNAKICSKCGRFFSAVRCPCCAYMGEAALFRQGCPNCGYAGSWRNTGAEGDFTVENLDDEPGRRRVGDRSAGASSIPGWVYWLAMALLGVAFLVLVAIYRNL